MGAAQFKKALKITWNFPSLKNFPGILLKLSCNIPETFMELSWNFHEIFLELSWNFDRISLNFMGFSWKFQGHSKNVLEMSGTPVRQMWKDDPVLLALVPVEEDGEDDGENDHDSGRGVRFKGPSSKEVLRSRIPCHPDVQRPDMPLTLTQVKHAQCSGQTQGSQHVDESPVPVKCHPPRVLALVDLTKSEVAKDWEDDKCWVVDDHPCLTVPTSQGLEERE